MEYSNRQEHPHFSDLAHEEVWIAEEESRQDAEHARELARLGFGFAGGRFALRSN